MYIYYVYINTHTCKIWNVKTWKICYVHILNIFICNKNYMNINIDVNASKYFQNIYCMCLYLYIHNKYTQHTHIYYVNKNFYFGCEMWITCDVFISSLDSHSDGTHSLQMIHWWASDVMLKFSKPISMKKQTHLRLGLRMSTFSANWIF